MQKLYRKAKIVDASFDLRAEPTTARAAWDIVRDSLERGMRRILKCGLKLTDITETNAQQAFVDILENDVIIPLVRLNVSEELLLQEDIPVLIIGWSQRHRMMWQESGSRKISRNLLLSTLITQRTISRSRNTALGNTFYSTDGSRRSQDVPNRRLRSQQEALREAEHAQSEDGIGNITQGF